MAEKKERRQVRILIAEDCESQRQLLQAMCRAVFGEQVTLYVAENGLKAYEFFRHYGIDFVITDLMMPVKDGDWLVKEIKALDPDMPVMLQSGATGCSVNIKMFDLVVSKGDPRSLKETIVQMGRLVSEKTELAQA